jgi:hypothetical protein
MVFVGKLVRWGVFIDSAAKNNKSIIRWTILQQFQAMKYSEVCPQSACNFILKIFIESCYFSLNCTLRFGLNRSLIFQVIEVFMENNSIFARDFKSGI